MIRASLGIVTEQLQNYGGSEIYLLECMRRWQSEIDIVVYTTQSNPALLKEYGIDEDRVHIQLLEQFESEKARFRLLDELVIGPRLWERQIGQHDLYFHYLYPTQFVRKSPSIWFAAEPLRMLYDLRHLKNFDSSITTFHVYPRMEYDTASKSDLNVMMQVLEDLDQTSTFETLVTNSRMMDGYLESVYGRRADLIAYPGVNLPESPLGPVDNRTALFVGRFWSHKRIDLILEGLSLVENGNLIIVGSGAEGQKLTNLVESLGLKERVKFLNNLDNQQLDQVFRNVTCGIYTPVREPFGMMPLEAASHGLPVVITPDGGYTEALDSTCGYIVDPDPVCIAEALESLFSNHDLARQMGAAGRRKVEQFTWDHTAADLMKLFNRKLQGRQLSRGRRGQRSLLGAHYYPWYGAEEPVCHWNENSDYANVDDLPEQGIYSSDDRDLVAGHLELAEEAGLDYLVINLQVSGRGLDDRELQSVDVLFEMAAERAPELSLCFMVTCDKADSQMIDASLAWLEEKYADHPSYLRIRSKPVIWFFVTESFIGHLFYDFPNFSDVTRNFHRIAAAGFCFSKCLPTHYAEFFDGWSLYSPLQVAEGDECESLWESSYREFGEVKADGGLGVFTICPGFDDTGLTHALRENSDYRLIPRNETETYARMQDACTGLHEQADLVVVTSFNEFHENTHIEPSVAFGRQYIEATRQFSDQLKVDGGLDPREATLESSEAFQNVV